METQLLKQKHLLDWKHLPGENPFKLKGFENSDIFMHVPSYLVESNLPRQVDFIWHFSAKRALTGDTVVVIEAEMEKDWCMQDVEAYEGDL